MIALHLTELKTFMNQLLLSDTFDHFPLREASITTFTTFTIDGSLHPDFFDPEESRELQAKGRTLLLWKDVKNFCYSIIRGRHPPLQFKFIFQLSPKSCEQLIAVHNLSLNPEDIFSCCMNFQYKEGKLVLVTGTSLRIFTRDKSLDHAFDNDVRRFLQKSEITYEEL